MNGGIQYRAIAKVMPPLTFVLLNTMFFVAYPKCLAISLLTAIPKKGDLSLVTNYRGIQMLPALAVLFDRIIAKGASKIYGVPGPGLSTGGRRLFFR